MAASDVTTAMASAVSSLQSGDYATALTWALCAQAYLAAIPDARHGEQGTEWDREGVKEFIRSLRMQQVGAAGIQRTAVTKTRVTSTE